MLDTIIIGSGPAGMSAAIYGKRANLSLVVVEKEYEGTGQIAFSHSVDNYPGFLKIDGYDLGEKIRNHALVLGTAFRDGEVTEIQKLEDGKGAYWHVTLDDGDSIDGRTILYAAGAQHRKLSIPGESEFIGKGISFCAVCDGAFYQDKNVAVIGGGDTALNDALYLADICKKVYLIHRRNEFRGSVHTFNLVKERDNIEIMVNLTPIRFYGEKVLKSVELSNGTKLEVEGVFEAVGMIPQTGLVRNLVLLNQDGYIVADETGATDTEGFFAAGDVRTKILRQVVTAVADGANAMTGITEYLQRIRKP